MATSENSQEVPDVQDWQPDLDSTVSVLDAFRTAAEKVRESDRSLGLKYYSLNIFPPWSPTRKFCRWVVGSERVQLTFLAFAMASCLSSIGGPNNNFDLLTANQLGEKLRSDPGGGLWTLVDLSAALVLSVEVIFNTIANGLYSMRGAYLRTSIFNRIDFIVFISFWVEQIVVLAVHQNGDDAEERFMISLQSFRLLRVFKPLTHFSFFYGVRTIFETLDEGWRHMGVVLSFLLLFLVGFSILTVAFFASSLRRRCVWAEPSAALAGLDTVPAQKDCLRSGEWEMRCELEPLLVQPEQWCGVWEDGGETVSSCGVGRLCVLFENPNCGLSSFDHLPASVLVLFQAVSTDRFPEVLNRCLQSEPHLVVVTVPLFFAVLFTCSQLLVNMFAAVTTERFAKVRERYGAALTAQVWQSQIDYVIDWAHENGYTITELFERFDVNKNGSVTRQELVHGLAALNLAALPRNKVAKMVDQLVDELDADKNGVLSVEEISVLLEQYEDLRAMTEMHSDLNSHGGLDFDEEEDEREEERAERMMKLNSAIGAEAGGMFVRKHQHKAYGSDRSSVYSMSFLNAISSQAHKRYERHVQRDNSDATLAAQPPTRIVPVSRRGSFLGGVDIRQPERGGSPVAHRSPIRSPDRSPLPGPRREPSGSHVSEAAPPQHADHGGGRRGEPAAHAAAPLHAPAHRSESGDPESLLEEASRRLSTIESDDGSAEGRVTRAKSEPDGGAAKTSRKSLSFRSVKKANAVPSRQRRASSAGAEVPSVPTAPKGRFSSLPNRPQLGVLALDGLNSRRSGPEVTIGGYGQVLTSSKLKSGALQGSVASPEGATLEDRRGSVRGAWKKAGAAVQHKVSRKDSVSGLVAGTKQLMPTPTVRKDEARGGRLEEADGHPTHARLVALNTFRQKERVGRRELRRMTDDELIMYKFGIEEGELRDLRGIFQLLDKDSTGSLEVSEIKEVYLQLGVPEQKLKKRTIEAVIREVDADNNGTLDFVEFLMLLLRPEPGSAASKLYPSSELHPTSIQVVCNSIARGKALRYLIFISIVVNTISMAYRDVDCHDSCQELLDGIEGTFQTIFLVEILIRVVGAGGLAKFFLNSTNAFDLSIVILTSAAQLSKWAGAEGASITKALKVMPAFRVLRLMLFSKTFKHLLLFTASSITSVLNLLLFIVVVVLVFASFGMLLLGNTGTELTNFKDVFHACVTMFQVMTGDDWSLVLYSTMEQLEQKHGAAGLIVGSAFVTVFYVFATFVVNNLFIAVILESFDLQATQRDANRPSTVLQFLKKWWKRTYKGFVKRRLSQDDSEHDWLIAATGGESTGPRKKRGSQQVGAIDEREELIMLMESLEAHKDSCTLLQAATVLSGVSVSTKLQTENVVQLHPAPPPSFWSRIWLNLTGQDTNESLLLNPSDLKRIDAANRSGSLASTNMLASDNFISMSSDQQATASFSGPSSSMVSGSMLFASSSSEAESRRAIRAVAIRIQDHWLFQRTVLVVIVVSCVLLALEPPAPDIEGPVDHGVLKAVSDATTICFLVEFIIKVAANGFLRGGQAYIKSGWNLMDLLVLILSLLDMFLTGRASLGSVRSLRLGRCLKPLRLMRSNPGMRIIVNALAATWKPVLYVLLFSCFFFVCFAFVGMGVFGGRFQRCSHDRLDKVDCYGSWLVQPDGMWTGGTELDSWLCDESVSLEAPYLAPRVWGTEFSRVRALRVQTFDTFSAAMLTLFQISRLQWVGVMQLGTAVTEAGMAPQEDASFTNAIFFIIWILFSAFFITNLLVALLIDGFNNAAAGQSEQKRIVTASRHFAKLVRVAAFAVNKDLEAPQLQICKHIRRMVETWYFEFVSTLCVMLNVTFLCFNSVEVMKDPSLSEAMETQNQVFLFLLLVEVLLVMAAYGVPTFFKDGWNVLDFMIVAGGLVAQVLATFSGLSLVARCLRLLRVARLLKKSNSLRTMLNTLWIGLPQILNILLLLFLIVSMFSIFAVQTFGLLRAGTRITPTPMPGFENPNDFPGASFTSYPQAMKTLFQVLFGDDWHVLMYDGMVEPPYCTPNGHPELPPCGEGCIPSGDCGPGSHASVLFWILFQIVGESVMMNLFVGMVLDCFAKVEAQEAVFVNSTKLEQIVGVWNKSRLAHGQGFLPLRAVKAFLLNVPRPVGYMEDDGGTDLNGLDRHAMQLVEGELRKKVNKRRAAWQKRQGAKISPTASVGTSKFNSNASSGGGSANWEGMLRWREAQPSSRMGWLKHQASLVLTELFFPGWKHTQVLAEEGGLSFDEVIMTAFYWNCPVMVPNKMKQRRTHDVVQAFLHAEAGVIVQNMKRLRHKRSSPIPTPVLFPGAKGDRPDDGVEDANQAGPAGSQDGAEPATAVRTEATMHQAASSMPLPGTADADRAGGQDGKSYDREGLVSDFVVDGGLSGPGADSALPPATDGEQNASSPLTAERDEKERVQSGGDGGKEGELPSEEPFDRKRFESS